MISIKQEYEVEDGIVEGEVEYVDYTGLYIFRGLLKLVDAWDNNRVYRSRNIIIGGATSYNDLMCRLKHRLTIWVDRCH